ncbi:MAG: hypothetical protein IPJ01_10145 [Micavibrio sp.]|nr:hypothetical protein [Micavibrio sp.]
MQSIKERIKDKEKSLKTLKSSFNEVLIKLKKDTKEYNASYLGNVARRLMCFYFGEYSDWYDHNHKYNREYRIEKSQNWSKKENKFITESYYNIRNQEFGSRVGFICHYDDIFEAFYSDDLLKIWAWYCKENKYKESLDTFFKDCKKKDGLKFLEIYGNYLNRKYDNNHLIEVINEPSLKIKNMVLCITDLSKNR